ncbi:MAG: ABC transporter [Candidatus Hydrogenedentota bacterium]|nr:MAG: ABC transporter [Candidatus Hydrogenedentota bacterium]
MSIKQNIASLKRAATLARMARTGLAASTAKDDHSRQAARHALAAMMADARGIPMKIGQFLSDQGDGNFDALVEGIEPLALSEVTPAIEDQLGSSIKEVFTQLDESTAAASLGQVHFGVLTSGDPIAVKVQYPHIASAVQSELGLAGLLPGMGPVKKWGFDLNAYKQMLSDNMDRELDYRTEAARQSDFAEAVQIEGLIVPEVHTTWCRPGLLVQSREESMPLKTAANWPVNQRREVAEILMRTFFSSMFNAGMVHGDPNLGNLGVRKNNSGNPELVLYDYGCMVTVPERARLALLKLILGCMDHDETDALACFSEMGFDEAKLEPISNILPALSLILFEPFLKNDLYSVKYWNLGERTSDLLGELKWWFRSAGPPELFLMMRAFSGLVNHLEILKIIVNWRSTLLDTLPQDLLDEARAFQPKLKQDWSDRTTLHMSSVAEFLKVLVMEGHRKVVQVTMPAMQVSDLANLIPEEVLTKVQEAGINIHQIGQEACKKGIQPQELFTLKTGDRDYRVWLE